MTTPKDKWLSQLRAILTAAGSALTTWGLNDGNNWAPVAGVILALVSLLWGVAFHRDPANPGKIKWSLVRKFFNAAGTALVTYGVINPDKVDSVVALLAVLGPMLASLKWKQLKE